MAIVSLNVIKNWFRTGLKPNQEQFWDTWDSFWHKNDKIPASSIEGMDALLNGKASKAVLDDHLINKNAHHELFAKVRIVVIGDFIIFKRGSNPDILERTDFVMGIVEGQFINGEYLGGDTSLLNSFKIINQLEF
ncbi:hypothetical protein [Flavobacterium aestivum]|uniref:hypothetical protein n=1 Tax=Flavobacterium aestivum TaxID=3003257 RepID=UPI002285A7C3|nr:hypothetical protein [Flavobacterium aestivum]